MTRPLISFRAGAVECAVWENSTMQDGRPTPLLKATLERRYRDREGRWQSSTSFTRNEIALARHVLQQAFAWIIEYERNAAQRGDSRDETPRDAERPMPARG
ncbi:MAG: hypothetical protein WD534_15190 [Phycisphaeraceae bacterium]